MKTKNGIWLVIVSLVLLGLVLACGNSEITVPTTSDATSVLVRNSTPADNDLQWQEIESYHIDGFDIKWVLWEWAYFFQGQSATKLHRNEILELTTADDVIFFKIERGRLFMSQ